MSMNRITAILIVGLLASCASTNDYCYLNEQERVSVLTNIRPVLADLESESIRYIASNSVARDGKLYRDEDGCFVYIRPEPKNPGYGVLDGDGGIYIDTTTLEPKRVFWYRY